MLIFKLWERKKLVSFQKLPFIVILSFLWDLKVPNLDMLFQQELKLNLIENGQGGQSNAYLGIIYNPFFPPPPPTKYHLII